VSPLPSFPRLPLIPDPLGRIDVPEDLGSVTSTGPEVDPDEVGLTSRQVRHIWGSGRALYRTGVHPALQLCVRRHGKVVIDRAIGHARGNGPRDTPDTPKVLVTPDTPFCVFSTSKGITALVVHMLQERGALDINDRVTDYIPEYGRHGKGRTTIAHVLSHRAAVPSLPRALLELDTFADTARVVEAISDAKPFVKPGTLLAYHAVTGGVILGEVVQRATGKSIREVIAEEILEPLRFRWGNYGVAPEDVDAVGLSYVTGPKLFPPVSLLVSRALSQPIDKVVHLSNQPEFLTSVIPSASVITSANELGRFFEIFRCGGSMDGVHVMTPETLRRALTEQSRLEIDLTLGFPTRFSYGLMLGAKVISPFGRDTDLAFGHLGLINIMGWADPERGISVGLVNSGKAIVYPEIHRFLGVMQTIASEVAKIPESERPFVA
jgi:CubicO group peptidase (beta-lactamase class C family)